MNRTDFTKLIAEKTGDTIINAKKFVEAYETIVLEVLKSGEELKLNSFGTFKSSTSKEREGVNPQTGEKILIKSKKQPKFTFSKSIKDALN